MTATTAKASDLTSRQTQALKIIKARGIGHGFFASEARPTTVQCLTSLVSVGVLTSEMTVERPGSPDSRFSPFYAVN